MNREHLSYVLGKLVCWLRRGKHEYGPEYKRLAEAPYSFEWAKKCVICGHAHETEQPVRRVERRT
jgi:hypothetical protein